MRLRVAILFILCYLGCNLPETFTLCMSFTGILKSQYACPWDLCSAVHAVILLITA